MTDTILISAAVVSAGLALAIVAIIRKVASRSRVDDLSLEALLEFSTEKYKPLEQLLDQREFSFYARQEGFDGALGRRFRADRRRIFRRYLRALRKDFSRLFEAARILATYSSIDRPDLTRGLWRQRWEFERMMWSIEIRMMMRSAGIEAHDVHRLILSLDQMHMSLCELMVLPEPSPSSL